MVRTCDDTPSDPVAAGSETAMRHHRDRLTERLLHRLAATRGDPERSRLRDEIVLLNRPIAESVAARYRNRGAEYDDLLQVALLGLVKAVDRYDPCRGRGFAGFAVPTISGEVKRYFRDQCWGIRPTRRIQELQQALQACEPALTQALGRSPRAAELARAIGAEEGPVIEALSCDGYFHLLPLEAPTAGAGSALRVLDQIGEDDRHIESVENHETLAPLLAELTERERLLLSLRFDRGWTQSQIADRLGISQMQVSRLLTSLYLRLRERIQGRGRTMAARVVYERSS